ncbi:MAG TPA: hypothetical protein VGA24_02365 [Steroidobacteraceae bacterium]
MKTLFNRNTGIAAFAAVVIVGLTGLTLDRGHEGALPQGIVEIGNLEAVMVGGLTIATLPTVEVFGSREVHLADVAANADAQG